jgi:hypothetical protein
MFLSEDAAMMEGLNEDELSHIKGNLVWVNPGWLSSVASSIVVLSRLLSSEDNLHLLTAIGEM